MMESRFDRGMKVRKEVLGSEYVERAQARTTGVDPHDIAEVLLHVAVYAGVPAANAAFALAKKEFDQPARAAAEADSAQAGQEEDA